MARPERGAFVAGWFEAVHLEDRRRIAARDVEAARARFTAFEQIVGKEFDVCPDAVAFLCVGLRAARRGLDDANQGRSPAWRRPGSAGPPVLVASVL